MQQIDQRFGPEALLEAAHLTAARSVVGRSSLDSKRRNRAGNLEVVLHLVAAVSLTLSSIKM